MTGDREPFFESRLERFGAALALAGALTAPPAAPGGPVGRLNRLPCAQTGAGEHCPVEVPQ